MSTECAQPAVEAVVDAYRGKLEALIDVYYDGAVAGEHKSAELVRKLLQQHAALFGIGGSGGVTIAAVVDESADELAQLRSRRSS
jgi:hypothetical protein